MTPTNHSVGKTISKFGTQIALRRVIREKIKRDICFAFLLSKTLAQFI